MILWWTHLHCPSRCFFVLSRCANPQHWRIDSQRNAEILQAPHFCADDSKWNLSLARDYYSMFNLTERYWNIICNDQLCTSQYVLSAMSKWLTVILNASILPILHCSTVEYSASFGTITNVFCMSFVCLFLQTQASQRYLLSCLDLYSCKVISEWMSNQSINHSFISTSWHRSYVTISLVRHYVRQLDILFNLMCAVESLVANQTLNLGKYLHQVRVYSSSVYHKMYYIVILLCVTC